MSESDGRGWRYRLGMSLFFGAFPIFFAIPIIVPSLGLSAGAAAAATGGGLVAVEILWLASIPLLGKEGFLEVKRRAFGWLKLPAGPVGRRRHRIGVGLLIACVAIDVLAQMVVVGGHAYLAGEGNEVRPIGGLSFDQQARLYVGLQLATGAGVVVSLFVLGGDFWERLKRAFEWHAAGASGP